MGKFLSSNKLRRFDRIWETKNENGQNDENATVVAMHIMKSDEWNDFENCYL